MRVVTRNLITQTETAKRLMINKDTLRKWLDQGKLNRYEGGKICEDELREFIRRDKPANAPVLSKEKARHEKLKADLAELELKRRRGELLEVEEVKKDWIRMINSCKTKMLASPANVSPQLPGCDSVSEMERVLKKHIWQALEELANDNSAGNNLERSDPPVEATV